MDGLWQSEETVGGEDEALERVAVTQTLWYTLQSVPTCHKVLETRQLPNGRRYPFEIESIVWRGGREGGSRGRGRRGERGREGEGEGERRAGRGRGGGGGGGGEGREGGVRTLTTQKQSS